MLDKNYIKLFTIALTFLSLLFFFDCPASLSNTENKEEILNKIRLLQMPFIENKGQIKDERINYYAKTFAGRVFITKDGQIAYSFPKIEQEQTKWCMIKEVFIGATITQVKGEKETITKVNYFKGTNANNWGEPHLTYRFLNFGEIYEGIELKLKAYGENIEKLFYIKPNAHLENIKVKVEGAESINLDKKGALEIKTKLGILKFTAPLAYQENGNNKNYIDVAYSLGCVGGHEYSFKVGAYDKTKVLIIDPLIASSFLGGWINGDEGFDITLDAMNNIYVVGYTGSTDFPTTPTAYDTANGDSDDCFIAKFDNNLEHLLSSTFIGGNGPDIGRSIIIDSEENIYVTGTTSSGDFPTTPGAYDKNVGGNSGCFIVKFDNNLEHLLSSTFLGGSQSDIVHSISIDSNGNIYVAGETRSSNFPTTFNAYDKSYNGDYGDIFISKFDANLKNLISSTFIGGAESDYASSIAIDMIGNVYVAGSTFSSNFPTTANAYETTYNGGRYAIIAKFDNNLENLLASTFLDGDNYNPSRSTEAKSIFIDGNCIIHVVGNTRSANFPTTPNAYDKTINGRTNVFILKFDSNLEKIITSTFLGSTVDDQARSIFLDDEGFVYVTGSTFASDFPVTRGAYDTTFNGKTDTFISKLDPNLEYLLTSTFLGGSEDDCARAIFVDSNTNAYVVGSTRSSNFPTSPSAYDATRNSYDDVFIAKISPSRLPLPHVDPLPVALGECEVTLTPPTAIDSYAGTITATTNNPLNYNTQGTYTVTWTYDDGNGNTSTQEQTVIVDDIEPPISDTDPLPSVTGECKVTLTSPTATDTCMGTITATTTDPLTYNIKGTYTVTWTYDDGNGNTSTQEQTVIILKTVIPKQMHVFLGESIQAAINNASDGDAIIVHPGNFPENIDFLGKAITVKSTDPNNLDIIASTIIDGGQVDAVVTFKNKEKEDSLIIGITIQNGKNNIGGGVSCYDSDPSIIKCVIKNNVATESGGGIYCGTASPKITDCIISYNLAEDGAGIYCFLSNAYITNCTISKNIASNNGGGLYCFMSALYIKNCDLKFNLTPRGGGIYCYFSCMEIVNCLITNNIVDNGGGIYIYQSDASMIINCTFAQNLAFLSGSGIYYNDSKLIVANSIFWDKFSKEIYATNVDMFAIAYSDIRDGQYDYKYISKNNIYTDPLFVDPNNGNYYLQNNSMCIDAGEDPNLPAAKRDKGNILRPQDGNDDGVARWDMGAYEFVYLHQPNEPDQNQPFIPDANQPIEYDQNQTIDIVPSANNPPSDGGGGGGCFISILSRISRVGKSCKKFPCLRHTSP